VDDESLPADTRMGAVHLRVADLSRQSSFYEEVLGFSVLGEDGGTTALGNEEGQPLVVLHAAPGAPKPPPGTTGLFHVAFLMPTREALGGMILRVRKQAWPFSGFADHNVSEAAYLSDPEGNGIELYADRARHVWHTMSGEVFMTTEPLDVPGLLMAAAEAARKLPEGTVVGHVHLRVSSLETAESFYVNRIGFDVVTRSYPGALFVSAGGYHHHLAFNVWAGRGVRPPRGSLGLASFDIVMSSEQARRRILGGADEGTLFDLDDVGVRIARA
jgi:catechol 2,3-dioxygenase